MFIERILVARRSFRAHTARALDLAVEFASPLGAELIAVHVMSERPLSAAELKLAQTEFHAEIMQNVDVTPLVDAWDDAFRAIRSALLKGRGQRPRVQ
jgi:nucleotide-binding universal stress UspA family protein